MAQVCVVQQSQIDWKPPRPPTPHPTHASPPSLKEQKLEKGDYSFRRDGNLLMVWYKDKKEIYFLSTIHTMKTKWGDDELVPSKLALFNDYSKFMDGVD